MKYMRIVVTRYGGPEVLQVIEEERPEPMKGEVRVKVLAAGVSSPDIMAREGIHPETPKVPYTPGWDLVGMVDKLGDSVSSFQPDQIVAAMPISGAYAEYICLPQRKLIPVPEGLDAAETVSLILNYITAYQMMHRLAKVRPGQSVLIHGASGGVGTALLQLGHLASLKMFGTCSSRGMQTVSNLGAVPIDYKNQDFVEEIHKQTGQGVDIVFDNLGGTHIWRSRKALRRGGKVIAYGLTGSLKEGRLVSDGGGRRNPFHGIPRYAYSIASSWILPGRRRVTLYSIQWLMRLMPTIFRQDLIVLFNLLQQKKIKPLIAKRFPLADARYAQEMLGNGGVLGKIVLICNSQSFESERM